MDLGRTVWLWGSDIRTKVKSLKIDIAERTRNCESLLLEITYLNIYLNILVENHKKRWYLLMVTITVKVM